VDGVGNPRFAPVWTYLAAPVAGDLKPVDIFAHRLDNPAVTGASLEIFSHSRVLPSEGVTRASAAGAVTAVAIRLSPKPH
jgi:hypothetical protein